MHVCVYMPTYTHTPRQTYARAHAHTHKLTRTRTRTCTCAMHMRTDTHLCTRIPSHACTHICTYTPANTTRGISRERRAATSTIETAAAYRYTRFIIRNPMINARRWSWSVAAWFRVGLAGLGVRVCSEGPGGGPGRAAVGHSVPRAKRPALLCTCVCACVSSRVHVQPRLPAPHLRRCDQGRKHCGSRRQGQEEPDVLEHGHWRRAVLRGGRRGLAAALLLRAPGSAAVGRGSRDTRRMPQRGDQDSTAPHQQRTRGRRRRKRVRCERRHYRYGQGREGPGGHHGTIYTRIRSRRRNNIIVCPKLQNVGGWVSMPFTAAAAVSAARTRGRDP